MREIVILDTSVFCSLLRVPNRDQHHTQAMAELERLLVRGETLLLPLAAILETGNHIAQNGDGTLRRRVATAFVSQVQQAFSGEAPWTPTPLPGAEFRLWLTEFPEFAMRGIGLADLSIVRTWEQECAKFRGYRVRIWSHDRHLAGYDRAPEP